MSIRRVARTTASPFILTLGLLVAAAIVLPLTAIAAELISPLAAPSRASLLVKTHRSEPANLVGSTKSAGTGLVGRDTKRDCIYAAGHISTLTALDTMMGTNYSCAQVYDTGTPSWANWSHPYFVGDGNPDLNWAKWAQAVPGRTLVITVAMFPTPVGNDPNWRSAGAAGDFNQYAKALATYLVANGLGSAVIRLAPEANSTWFAWNVGNTPAQYAEWIRFWRQTVTAMRSVSGADFQFDWTVNAGYRDIPFADYYPGNSFVNIIGVDAYDNGISSEGSQRWDTVLDQPGGLEDVAAFAREHNKPLSIPEWGVSPTSAGLGGGDDPAYVNGIASIVENNDVAYQSYFFHNVWAEALASYSRSLAAYRADFGGGSANEPAGSQWSALTASGGTRIPPASKAR